MKKKLVKERIQIEITRRIVRGVYPLGEFIPTERALAEEFSASRTSVSKALFNLVKKGLIEQTTGRGTRVIPLNERPLHSSIAFIQPSPNATPPESSNIAKGVQQKLAQLNQRVEFLYRENKHTDITPDAIIKNFAGALLVETPEAKKLARKLEQKKFPYVIANLEEDINLTSTWVDHRQTTRTAVRLLASLGHSRIALLTRPTGIFFYQKAMEGYQLGLADAGIKFDNSLIITSSDPLGLGNSVSAYVRMREFLEKNRAPTGLVACRDYLAGGAYQAIIEANMEIGRDISIIGFDDISWPQSESLLTTFAEPAYQLGAIAAEILVERLISGWKPVERCRIDAPLVMRRSVGPCIKPCKNAGNDLKLVVYTENQKKY